MPMAHHEVEIFLYKARAYNFAFPRVSSRLFSPGKLEITPVDSVFGIYSLANYVGFRAVTPHGGGIGSDAYYASRSREVEKFTREYFRIF